MVTPLNLSAKFDRCYYNDRLCCIQDFKTGFKEPVKAKLNAQMKVNVLLAALNLHRAGVTTIQRYVAQIVTMTFGVMEAEWSAKELPGLYDEITGALGRLQSDRAELNPSIDACEYCEAILICSAVKDTLKPTITLLKASPITDYTRYDPKQLSQILDQTKVIRNYIEEFEKFCVENLTGEPIKTVIVNGEEQPFSITDYEMVPGNERRDWKDQEAACERLRKLGVEIHVGLESPAMVEKAYAKHFGKKVPEIKEAFRELMSDCIETKQNKPSLKRVKGESRIKDIL